MGGTGTLVPGPATFELQLIDNETVVGTQTIPVTLQPNTPGIASLTPTTTTIAIGSAPSYAATLRNPGAPLSNVILQGWINQGTVRNAAGGTMVFITGQAVGALPSGMFNVAGSISVSNTSAGSGTLVAGPATFELQMTMNGTLLESKTLSVTLA
jgi:hypothetical protein